MAEPQLRPAGRTAQSAAGGGTGAPWSSRLWRKYASVMVSLCVLAIGGFGAVEMGAAYIDAKAQASRLQKAEASEAALALRSALVNVDRHVDAVNELPWGPAWLGLNTRREEYARLLRLVPAAESIRYLGAAGEELLRVSRREVDRIAHNAAADQTATTASVAPAPAAPAASAGRRRLNPSFGRMRYGDDLEPVLDLTLADTDPALGGTTVVRLGLRALAREIDATLSLPGAEVYAVNQDGIIALHRDPSIMLARVRAPGGQTARTAQASAVSDAAAAEAAPGLDREAVLGHGLREAEVFRSTVPIAELGWTMVVERPRSTVMAPVWATVRRAAIFVTLGVLLAMTAALTLAGRLTRPIRQLHRAAARVGAGQLETSIEIRTGDELEELAIQFNRMAASLKASVDELEARVAARTLELEHANRHKSDFLANMSHELRTPLNAILGFADVLRDGMAGALNAEQKEYVGDIHASGLHLLALINDLLDLTRIEAGQLDLERSEFHVRDTVAAAAALLRRRCAQKGLRLEIEVAAEVGNWVADERRFKQIVLNLLGNAVKFTPEGGTVKVMVELGGEEGLCVTVQDNGVGIDAADHEAVFEEFRQVGTDAAGRAEGSGLGLALVRRLVEQHGGRVTLHSALGAGARFRFNIPRPP